MLEWFSKEMQTIWAEDIKVYRLVIKQTVALTVFLLFD